MANKVNKVASKGRSIKVDSKLVRYLIAIPVVVFLIKVIIVFNIPQGAWLGADGENYTGGVDGLLKDGFFSKESKLSYWPAGYPLLLWMFAKISISNFFFLISIVQSLFFAYATYYFTSQLRKSSIKYLAFITTILISLNPTLSLSTLAVGYEAPIAACFMMVFGLAIKYHSAKRNRRFWIAVASMAAWFGLAILMQPRFLLAGFIFMGYWAYTLKSRKITSLAIALSLLIMLISPGIMMYRNSKAINQATISTNLGVNMAIGAGEDTKGGYNHTGPDVPCEPTPPSKVVTDNQRVICVIKWSLSNPVTTLKLAFNKSQYFWSPWSGPLGEGTMARNPWLKIAPTKNIASTQDGYDFIYGGFGKLVSYGWILGQLFLLFWGYRVLRKRGTFEKIVANLSLIPIVTSWLISIGTFGDHRFRVPIMCMSLFLQAAGFMALKEKISKAL